MQLPQVVEIKGIRVLTTEQLAKEYGTEAKTLQNNFAYNKPRYSEGKHYIELKGEELKRFKTDHEIQGQFKHVRSLYLWTEKGALLHAKSLNTDKAWEVYDYLVDHYFRTQGQQAPEVKETKPAQIGKAPAPMWTNGRLTPAKDLVANIPDNKEAQHLITDMRRYLAGMDALLDIYNMYHTQTDFAQITGTVKEMSDKISWVASEIRRVNPKFVEKFI